MAERKKNRKRKDEIAPGSKPPVDKPSKEEYAVAKWIRKNVKSKKTKFVNHNVEYFTGSRAVDALVENSPWSKTLFETREQVDEFLDTMLRHKFFHRAKKVVVTEEELNKLRGLKKKVKDCCRDDNIKKEKDNEKDNNELKDKDDDTIKDVQPKKKPKVRLEMHMEQFFCDCNDAYVWIYEPIPIYYWFFGTLVVLGAIGVCLFPLWPLTIRHGVYYLSVAAAGFFVFIIALVIIRVIIFSIVWVLTFGRHHLHLLPNLTEDVGFFASFWPLYKYEYHGPENDKSKNKKKKPRKDKDSDGEENFTTQSEPEKNTNEKNNKKENKDDKEDDGSGEDGSESEKSNTGKDFEIVQHNEVDI